MWILDVYLWTTRLFLNYVDGRSAEDRSEKCGFEPIG